MVLIGRASEIAAALGDAGVQGRASLLLAGAPGVGKSELARALVARHAEAGAQVVPVTASSTIQSVPFGAFAPLIDRLGLEPTRPLEVLARTAAEVEAMGGDAPTVVFVDDAHLLDDLSSALVHRLAVDGVSLVLTVRTSDGVPEPITALWKDDLVRRIDVDPLDREATAELVEHLLDGGATAQLHERLWSLSQGVPLYVRELVLAGRHQGWLRPDERGRWIAEGAPQLGPRLRELIEARIATCTDSQRLLLDALAVAEPLGPDLVRQLAPIEDVLSLEQRHLVRPATDRDEGALRTDHPLMAEVLRATMSPTRRRQVCDRLMRHLEGTVEAGSAAMARLASISAGSSTPDPVLLEAGSRHAARCGELDEAVALADVAVRCGGGATARLALGDALNHAGRFDQAVPVLRGAIAEAADPEVRVDALICLATAMCWGQGMVDRALADLEEGANGLSEVLQAELEGFAAGIHVVAGHPLAALERAERVLRHRDVSPRGRLRAATATCAALVMLGRSGELERALAEHLPDAFAHLEDFPAAAADLLASQLVGQRNAGDRAAAESGAMVLFDSADRADVEQRSFWSFLAGLAALARGHAAAATRRVDAALAGFHGRNAARIEGWALAASAHAYALLGDIEAAEDRLAASTQPPAHAFEAWDEERWLARAHIAAAAGDLDTAIACCDEGAAAMRRAGRRSAEVALLHLMSRLGAPEEALARLREADLEPTDRVAPAAIAHAAALVDRDATALLAASTELEGVGDDLSAAEAAVVAAEVHWAAGRTGSSILARDRARQLAARCEGARTPVLRRLEEPEAAISLTSREREIAVLAARGLTNTDIAEHLFISARTVGNHLYRIYAKLEISGRAELKRVFAEDHPDTIRPG